ncbi:MAG: polysaccharide lyase family 7 protein [Pseudomonadota bacterium]|jgi:hypothetical protein|uniref:Alginate lyase 2 domain-containing protein n=1 Tax=hydrothermal vent metagenome TaxID=652676 RepID=A0A160TGS0_9ZZZZ
MNSGYLRAGLAVLGCSLGLAATPALAFGCNTTTDTANAPYSASKYKAVIDNSQALQVQSTSTCLTTADMQAFKIDIDNWRLDGGNMAFAFTGGNTGDRVELRGKSFSGSATGKKWSGKIKLQNGGNYSDEFTVGQIFGESTQDPILRLEFYASRSGVSNHIWAVYRTGTGSAAVEYVDLGPATTSSYTQATMEYGSNNRIQVTYGSTVHDFTTNFGYWDNSGKSVYFKAGCYLQGSGNCSVTFSSLTFSS